MHAESRVEKPLPMYVPRDEQFEELKTQAFSSMRVKALFHNLIPSLKANLSSQSSDFNDFSDVDDLYDTQGFLQKLLKDSDFAKKIPESSLKLFKFDTPMIISSELLCALAIYEVA